MAREPLTLIECGCCGAYHRVEYRGDCRNDAERFDEILPGDTEMFEDGSYVVEPVRPARRNLETGSPL